MGLATWLLKDSDRSDGTWRRRFREGQFKNLRVQHIRVGGKRRTYYFHLPKRRDPELIPLVVALHGGRAGAIKFMRMTRLDRIADRYGFAVAFPNSSGYWNDGRDTTANGPDDLAFIGQLVDHLTRSQRIDPKRIYATGASSGGMLTLRLACEMSCRFAAFAAVMASMPVSATSWCRPSRPVPVLFINGTEDRFIRWNGGEIISGPDRGAGGKVLSLPKAVSFWQVLNGCHRAPMVEKVYDRNESDGLRVEVIRFHGCRPGGALELIKVWGGGHTWPGTQSKLKTKYRHISGRTSLDINAGQEIWRFFSGHRLP